MAVEPEVKYTEPAVENVPKIEAGDASTPQAVKRKLSARHVQLMAVAGAIGIGLFVGIGGVLSRAGPISLTLGYMFYGLCFIWPLTLHVGEMCAWLPIRGSLFGLASRLVDPALGFAMGWTYFFASLMLVCTEYSAVATVMQYWTTDINPGVWVAIAMALCVLLNIVAVRWYGESEFVFASCKVILLVGLMMVTFVTMVGGNPRNDAYGFRNWTDGNAMHSYYAEGATGRFLGIWISVRYAVFTVGGPAFLALSAGEISNPRRTIPRVAKLIVWRVVGLYVMGALAVGIICPSRDPEYLQAVENGEPGAGSSPWVFGITKLRITTFLPDAINFMILLSGFSCGNTFLYTASRSLYSLAQNGQAPKMFLRCSKKGIPYVAVLSVTLVSCVSFLVTSNNAIEVFDWFVGLTSAGLIINETATYVVVVHWHHAIMAQNLPLNLLPYKSPLAPYTGYWGILVGICIIMTLGFDTFAPWDTKGFITSYFGVGYFVVLFVAWKLWHKTRYIPSIEADIWTGKAEIDEECLVWESEEAKGREKERRESMGVLKRVWEGMWLFYWSPEDDFDSNRPSNAFTAAAFLANEAWLTSQYFGHWMVNYDRGADIAIPTISLTGIVVVSMLIGGFLTMLLALAIYSATHVRWADQLDAFAMLRIGASISEDIQFRPVRNVQKIETLDMLPGWIGDVGDEQDDIGQLGLGASNRLNGKRKFATHEISRKG